MKLEKEEIEKIKALVLKYQQMHTEVVKLEKAMESLGKEKDHLIFEMKETRRDEVIFIADLKDKYGENIVTPDLLKEIVLC